MPSPNIQDTDVHRLTLVIRDDINDRVMTTVCQNDSDGHLTYWGRHLRVQYYDMDQNAMKRSEEGRLSCVDQHFKVKKRGHRHWRWWSKGRRKNLSVLGENAIFQS